MIIWIMDADSGIKLVYKSFLKKETDEDIISGFLTTFHKFSMVEFKESIESIEMGGLRWVYIIEPELNLLFVAADTKEVKTQILAVRLEIIKKEFINQFEYVWRKRGTWDGHTSVYDSFINTIEEYNSQWKQVEKLTEIADVFDIIQVFQRIFIMLRDVVEKRMYTKHRTEILDLIENNYKNLLGKKSSNKKKEIPLIEFSKTSWVEISDINLMKGNKEEIIHLLQNLLSLIVSAISDIKGKVLCYKYFNDERIFSYIYKNLKLLKDLDLDSYMLKVFLLI